MDNYYLKFITIDVFVAGIIINVASINIITESHTTHESSNQLQRDDYCARHDAEEHR